MKDNMTRYTLRMPRIIFDKLHYISEYKGRSANKQIEQIVKKFISDFEAEHGEITEEQIQELYRNEI